ncbi:MAG: iron-sulfur cluster assembly scaffold protein [Candidatus Aenigmatarchaeota archaeon]
MTGSELFIITYKQERKHFFVHKREKSFLVPIRRIERQPFDDIVYNFHVESKPNSYLVRGFAVHNCVAAIATSSMITELAMGKTLEEAMKISNKDIAHALKGLPPIKMHCSVLAADALHKAIEDYLKKSKTAKK